LAPDRADDDYGGLASCAGSGWRRGRPRRRAGRRPRPGRRRSAAGPPPVNQPGPSTTSRP